MTHASHNMPIVVVACCLLVAATTLLHYEVLRALNVGLPRLAVPNRSKLLIVIIAAFFAHVAEIALYGAVTYAVVQYFGAGSLTGSAGFSFESCMYFSAETYTSLGFGDLTPVGPVRMVAGAEALNGLLLIGWSASFTYIAMERFWNAEAQANDRRRGG